MPKRSICFYAILHGQPRRIDGSRAAVFPCRFYSLEQLLLVNGFKQIILRPQPDGLLHQIKFIISCQNNAVLHAKLPGLLHQFQTIHLRHAKIGDEKIGQLVPDGSKGINSIADSGNLNLRPALPNETGNAVADFYLVIHHHNFHPMGRRKIPLHCLRPSLSL